MFSSSHNIEYLRLSVVSRKVSLKNPFSNSNCHGSVASGNNDQEERINVHHRATVAADAVGQSRQPHHSNLIELSEARTIERHCFLMLYQRILSHVAFSRPSLRPPIHLSIPSSFRSSIHPSLQSSLAPDSSAAGALVSDREHLLCAAFIRFSSHVSEAATRGVKFSLLVPSELFRKLGNIYR